MRHLLHSVAGVYGPEAITLRRCRARTRAGYQCYGWAVWNDPDQRCRAHGGRAARPPIRGDREKTRFEPCRCAAYAWPHRPGGGICRWPEEPLWRCTTPAGTHAEPRLRR